MLRPIPDTIVLHSGYGSGSGYIMAMGDGDGVLKS